MQLSLSVGVSSMWLQIVLLLTALLLPGGKVLGAPTQSPPGRHFRGDRTVPPPGSIDGVDELFAERTRREVSTSADTQKEYLPAGDDGRTRLARTSQQSGRGTQGSPSGSSLSGTSEARMDSRKVHKNDSDEDYYYYYYYDSFVEGVTTRDDLDEYSENGPPIDLENDEDESDDGEIMELLNLAPRQAVA